MQRDSVKRSSDTNVVSIFRKKDTDDVKKVDDLEEEESFLGIMKKNLDNKTRLAKERAKANQSVIRSHRLKR